MISGCLCFVRLPATGLAVDLPLIGPFPIRRNLTVATRVCVSMMTAAMIPSIGRHVVACAGMAIAASTASAKAIPSGPAIDAHVAAAMAATGARSVAVAVVDHGRPVYVRAYGVRTAAGAPLTNTSILYGASLTKAVFAYLVLRLVDERVIDLDKPLERYLPRPLSSFDDSDTVRRYGDFSAVGMDPRWHAITARTILNHASGLPNLTHTEPDGKERLHFDPGSRYAYSGAGLLLLQLVLEKGLGLDVAREAQRRVFDPLGMVDTSFTWRDDFAGREATGWTLEGAAPGHAHQSRVRVAGSIDTTIADMARFAAAMVSGTGLSARSHRELARPQLAITTASQFPTLQPEAPPARRHRNLAVGTVVITFAGPQGPGFMKGGHNDTTGNTMICLTRSQRCLVILGADVRAEALFPELARFVLGETGFAWQWEYGDMRFWMPRPLLSIRPLTQRPTSGGQGGGLAGTASSFGAASSGSLSYRAGWQITTRTSGATH